MIRDLVQAEIGHIGDQDAELCGMFHGDVIEPDPVAADDLALGRGVEYSDAKAVNSSSLPVSATTNSMSRGASTPRSISSDGQA